MTASGTTASHYMSYMNVFFTAQKLNILVSVLQNFLSASPRLLQSKKKLVFVPGKLLASSNREYGKRYFRFRGLDVTYAGIRG